MDINENIDGFEQFQNGLVFVKYSDEHSLENRVCPPEIVQRVDDMLSRPESIGSNTIRAQLKYFSHEFFVICRGNTNALETKYFHEEAIQDGTGKVYYNLFKILVSRALKEPRAICYGSISLEGLVLKENISLNLQDIINIELQMQDYEYESKARKPRNIALQTQEKAASNPVKIIVPKGRTLKLNDDLFKEYLLRFGTTYGKINFASLIRYDNKSKLPWLLKTELDFKDPARSKFYDIPLVGKTAVINEKACKGDLGYSCEIRKLWLVFYKSPFTKFINKGPDDLPLIFCRAGR